MGAGGMVFGAIADDLTGGVELAGMLAAGGARVALVTDADAVAQAAAEGEADAIVVALRIRVAPRAAAVAAVQAAGVALHAAGARQLFLKYCATFDSTDDGNIGPAADALRDIAAPEWVLFCPSFPAVERTVFRGHLFVGDQLVSNSPKRFDPLTPMTDPDLVQVLGRQTRTRVGLLSAPVVAKGGQAVQAHMAALARAGTPYAIADATNEDDLRTLAQASVTCSLVTGGSSIAAYYPAIWRSLGWIAHEAPAVLPPADGRAAVIAGSCAARTQEQVAAFAQDHPVHAIDLLSEAGPDSLVAAALDWAASRLAAGPVGFTSAPDDQRVAAAQAAFGPIAAARRAEAVLGGIAAGLVRLGVRRLMVAGGETSGAAVAALGARRLQIAPYVAPGIGLCRATESGVTLCLKSGKLGEVDMFARVLRQMQGAAA